MTSVYQCSIDARNGGAQGVYHIHAVCQVHADNEEVAKTKAFTEFCVNRGYETTPPMLVREVVA